MKNNNNDDNSDENSSNPISKLANWINQMAALNKPTIIKMAIDKFDDNQRSKNNLKTETIFHFYWLIFFSKINNEETSVRNDSKSLKSNDTINHQHQHRKPLPLPSQHTRKSRKAVTKHCAEEICQWLVEKTVCRLTLAIFHELVKKARVEPSKKKSQQTN